MSALFYAFATIVLDIAWVSGVYGSVEALPCVQSDGVLMPRTDDTKASMTVLYKQPCTCINKQSINCSMQLSTLKFLACVIVLTSISPIDSGPPVSANQGRYADG